MSGGQGRKTSLGCVILLCIVIIGGLCVIANFQVNQQSQITDQANIQFTQTAVELGKEATAFAISKAVGLGSRVCH
jgi:hypothetical protein